MSKTLRWVLGILVALAVLGALFIAGFAAGSMSRSLAGFWPGLMGRFMAARSGPISAPAGLFRLGFQMGPGMMDFTGQETQDEPPCGYDGFGGYAGGRGMMGGGYGRMGPGMMGGGRRGGYGSAWCQSGGEAGAEPISLDQARQAVEAYLAGLDDPDLAISEIMIFDNHAYAEIVEQSTGTGAMEVLVDPSTLTVYPEHGPNMMWNLKYSPMGGYGRGYGMMGPGMMGGYYRRQGLNADPQAIPDMTVTPEQAIAAAQAALDEFRPGAQAGTEAEPFYGYYTLHFLQDGNIAGMLSVNGYSGEVFIHAWHGEFVEMSEE